MAKKAKAKRKSDSSWRQKVDKLIVQDVGRIFILVIDGIETKAALMRIVELKTMNHYIFLRHDNRRQIKIGDGGYVVGAHTVGGAYLNNPYYAEIYK